MKIIALANHKGGVGKTTSVASIGAELALRGYETLLIDLDAQQNLSYYFLKGKPVEKTIYDTLINGEPLPFMEVRERLYLSPSIELLARVDILLSSMIARESRLKRAIFAMEKEFDYILLDTPPSLGLLTMNALTAANEVYIPLTAEAFPMIGFEMFEEFIEEVSSGVNPELEIGGIFFTRYNHRRLNQDVEERVRRLYGDKVFKTKIRENITLAEAPLTGRTISEYDSSSNGARDYKELVNEILTRGKD